MKHGQNPACVSQHSGQWVLLSPQLRSTFLCLWTDGTLLLKGRKCQGKTS